jgi:hypothetical protein
MAVADYSRPVVVHGYVSTDRETSSPQCNSDRPSLEKSSHSMAESCKDGERPIPQACSTHVLDPYRNGGQPYLQASINMVSQAPSQNVHPPTSNRPRPLPCLSDTQHRLPLLCKCLHTGPCPVTKIGRNAEIELGVQRSLECFATLNAADGVELVSGTVRAVCEPAGAHEVGPRGRCTVRLAML